VSGGGCRDVLDVYRAQVGSAGIAEGWRGVGFAGAFAEEGAALVGVVASRRAFGQRGDAGWARRVARSVAVVAGPRAWWHWLLRGFAGVVGLSCCCIAVRAKRGRETGGIVLVARGGGVRLARRAARPALPGVAGLWARTTPALCSLAARFTGRSGVASQGRT
jgi:hypothetical protein